MEIRFGSFLHKIPLLSFCFSYLAIITHLLHVKTMTIMIKLKYAFSFRVVLNKKTFESEFFTVVIYKIKNTCCPLLLGSLFFTYSVLIFLKNDIYSSRKRVIFLRRIMTEGVIILITEGHYSTYKNCPRSLLYGNHYSSLHRPYKPSLMLYTNVPFQLIYIGIGNAPRVADKFD